MLSLLIVVLRLVEVSASGSSLIQSNLPSVMCLSVIVKSRRQGGPGPQRPIAPWKQIGEYSLCFK
jgi:hypothetical protein